LKIVVAIEDPPAILSPLGLPSRASPVHRRASRSSPNDLRSRKPLANQADGAARSEFERAAG
jgi:hypothetical protein